MKIDADHDMYAVSIHMNCMLLFECILTYAQIQTCFTQMCMVHAFFNTVFLPLFASLPHINHVDCH